MESEIDIKLVLIGIVVVFLSVYVLIYIFDNLYKIKAKCELGQEQCKINTFHIIILMLLLIAGGLVIVISTTSYILITGKKEV
ncbi:MAG: hypothetical protein QXF12_07525 [Candidatus Aenigmatarchaeota archaeon]